MFTFCTCPALFGQAAVNPSTTRSPRMAYGCCSRLTDAYHHACALFITVSQLNEEPNMMTTPHLLVLLQENAGTSLVEAFSLLEIRTHLQMLQTSAAGAKSQVLRQLHLLDPYVSCADD